MHRLKFLIPLVLFLIMAVLLGLSLLFKGSEELPSALIGRPVPEFDLPLTNSSGAGAENSVTSQTFMGQPYLINLWQIRCPGCRQEHDLLKKISLTGVPIVGVNVADETGEIESILNELGNPYVASAVGVDARLHIDIGSYGTPETYLVGADGVIKYRVIGPLSEALWRDELGPMLYD